MPLDHRFAALSVLAAGALALGACGKSDGGGESGAGNQGAAPAAMSSVRLTPGRWETTMKIVKMEIPGMPPQAQEAMKSQMGRLTSVTRCLTKEQADKSERDFFKPRDSGDCKFTSFSMGAGTIAGEMACNSERGTQTMKMAGTYGAEAYAMKVSSESDMAGRKMSMDMEMASKRVGDCDGSETG